MLRRLVLVSILPAICVAGCARTARVSPGQTELQGAWDVAQVTTDGEPEPPEEIRGMRFVFAGEKLTMAGPREGPDEVTVKLDPAQVPATMDLIHGETTIPAIYKLDRDTLTIVTPTRHDVRRARPATFAAPRGSELSVIILKRP